jgi:23S rRNA (uracil1939-C5)-methyltransferase
VTDQRLLQCPHRPPCPGCPRFGEGDVPAPVLHALNQLARAHRLPAVSIVSGDTAGFRLRARVATLGRRGSPKIGLFELGTHRVVHIPNCSVQHPLINRVASIVRRALADARVTSYSDRAHLGVARYLQVVVERSSQTAQVVIVANCATLDPLAACLGLIRERLGEDLHSLWFNPNLEHTNTILGPDFQLVCGPKSVVEGFGGASVHYPPGAFGQNNLDIAERIIEHVRDLVPQDADVAEFYAGVGAIGLSLLPRVRTIRLNELNPHSLHGLELGLAELASNVRSKISVIPGPASVALPAAREAQVVIADPPRKGLDAELTAHLSAQPPERFVYISCGIESFLADAAALMSRSKLRLAALKGFNLMPFTEHIETVACFERV